MCVPLVCVCVCVRARARAGLRQEEEEEENEQGKELDGGVEDKAVAASRIDRQAHARMRTAGSGSPPQRRASAPDGMLALAV